MHFLKTHVCLLPDLLLLALCCTPFQHLEVRNLVVRHKLLVPSKTREGGWSLTSIVHHTRFMPTSMFGPHCVLQVRRVQLVQHKMPA
jgi:hypothetical protein